MKFQFVTEENINLLRLEAFLHQNQLHIEPGWQAGVLVFDESKTIIACGFLKQDLLVMIAIDQAYRGRGLLKEIIARLTELAKQNGIDDLFLYTRKRNQKAFQSCGFVPIVTTEIVYMCSNPFAFPNWLSSKQPLCFPWLRPRDQYPRYFCNNEYEYQNYVSQIEEKMKEIIRKG